MLKRKKREKGRPLTVSVGVQIFLLAMGILASAFETVKISQEDRMAGLKKTGMKNRITHKWAVGHFSAVSLSHYRSGLLSY